MKPTTFVTLLCSSCFSIRRNRILYIIPECTSVVTTKKPYHAGLFSTFPKSVQNFQVFKVLFLWNVPLIDDSHVPVKMRDEGDSARRLQAAGCACRPRRCSWCPRHSWLHTLQKYFSFHFNIPFQDNIMASFEKLGKNLVLSCF